MMSQTPLSCIFDRDIPKSGDFSSVDVKEASVGDPQLSSFGASSMRQVYVLSPQFAGTNESDPRRSISFAFPGGASEDPFSLLYDNLAYLYSRDAYVAVDLN